MKTIHKRSVFKLIIVALIIVGGIFFIRFLTEKNDEYRISTVKNFPDPAGLVVKDKYYAYATSSGEINIPVASSKDNKNYKVIDDALPVLPDWALPGIWAPDVFYNGKEYVMYYSAINKQNSIRQIGSATSGDPEGPFKVNNRALVSNDENGGLIDPEFFEDTDGKKYILYKNDGNSTSRISEIWVQEVSEDGLETVGTPTSLLKNTDVPNPLDNGNNKIAETVEAPCIVKAPDGTYVLFFSGNLFLTSNYFTGYAISPQLKGPYKYVEPLVTTATQKETNKIMGPGGLDVIGGISKNSYALLHGWVNGNEAEGGVRKMFVRHLTWTEGHIPHLEE